MGLTTEDDLEEMARDWKEWADRDDASLAMISGEILIQKENNRASTIGDLESSI